MANPDRIECPCPSCGKRCKVDAAFAGRRVRCAGCKESFRLPGQKTAAPAAPAARAPGTGPAAAAPCWACGEARPPSGPCPECGELPPAAPPPGLSEVAERARQVVGHKAFRPAVFGLLLLTLAAVGGDALYKRTNGYQYSILHDRRARPAQRDQALQRLLDTASPADIASLLDSVDDPVKRGAYPSLAAASDDPRFAADVLAYVAEGHPPVQTSEVKDARRHLAGLAGFGPQVMADTLFPVYVDAASGEYLRAAVYELLVTLPPAVLRTRVLSQGSLEVRGSFPEVLASTGDPGQFKAILCWAQAKQKQGDRWTRATAALIALDRKRAAKDLVAVYGTGQDDHALRTLLRRQFQPKELEPHVLALQDEVRRGGFPRVLGRYGDPAQASALFAFARDRQLHPQALKQWTPYLAALVSLGPEALPAIREWLDSHTRHEDVLALQALFGLAPAEGSQHVIKVVDAYQQHLITNWAQIQMRARLNANSGLSTGELDLYKERAKFRPLRLLEGIRHLEGDAVDFCFLRGLSCLDASVAQTSAKALDERLSVEALVDALFRFIASKNSFDVAEVDVYHGLLDAKGTAGAARVVDNLERLLRDAGGSPDDVFFLYKVLGVRALEKHGTRSALDTAQRYAKDASAYVHQTTETSRGPLGLAPRTERSRKEILFAEEWRRVIKTIGSR